MTLSSPRWLTRSKLLVTKSKWERQMIDTHTTEVIANHRSIRAFKAQTLAKEQLTTLYKMASQTSTSMFMQQFSILHVTDPAKRAAIRAVSGQRYVGANGDLFIFIVDLYRTNRFASNLVMTMGACIRPTSSFKRWRTQSWRCKTLSRPPKAWAWAR